MVLLIVLLGLIDAFFGFIHPRSFLCLAAQSDSQGVVDPGEVEGESFWRNLKTQGKLRIRYSNEWVTPTVGSKTVPTPTGGIFGPSGVFNNLTFDYAVAHNFRLLYFQRVYMPLGTNANFSRIQPVLRDPRVGVRWTQVFNDSHVTSTYDFFLQPQVTHNAFSTGNGLDIGVRLNHVYTFPRSKWSIGAITDIVTSYQNPNAKGPRCYGFFAPWASYEISPKFSTQNWLGLNYMNPRSLAWYSLAWDTPLPSMQNGVSWNFVENMSLSFLINNYLQAAPTLSNTWASVWFSLVVL